MKKYTVNGFEVYGFKSLEFLARFSLENPGIYISINAETIYKSSKEFKALVNENYGFCDGVGATLYIKHRFKEVVPKIAGCELWLKTIELANDNRKIAILGASEHIHKVVVSKLKSEFNANIVFSKNGFYQEDDSLIVKQLIETKPDLIFIAIGQPKQEIMASKIKERLKSASIFPIGGSFDVYSGLKKRAPRFFINNNLEWLYRLLKEPTRIKRQWILVKFILLLLLNRL